MIDRELLELAAKAAGIKGHFVERTPEDGYPGYTCGIQVGQLVLWNPLTDDGDALRLAVACHMDIKRSPYEMVEVTARGRVCNGNLGTKWGEVITVEHFGDYIEPDPKDSGEIATRRAIVRAAAELGKAML